jgi:xanthine/uracil permease
MNLRYQIDDIPEFKDLILIGLQWFVVILPIIIIVSKILGLAFNMPYNEQIVYIEKICFIIALSLFSQVLFGHKLPMISGPATVLLAGILASKAYSYDSIYTSIIICGLFVSCLSLTRFMNQVLLIFTSNVVATVLILIAFVVLPSIIELIMTPFGYSDFINILFAILFIMLMFALEKNSKGIWKSSVILLSLIIGTTIYYLLTPSGVNMEKAFQMDLVGNFFKNMTLNLDFNVGLIVSFFICFIGLTINDMGSIQSVNTILNTQNQSKRLKRGVFITGIMNSVSGLFGVVGPVNFSLSPGIIAITSSASRYILLVTALLLFILSISPFLLALIGNIPSIIIGCIFFYVMCSQVASGLSVVFGQHHYSFRDGVVIGCSILTGTAISFMPLSNTGTIPDLINPIVTNGFVMGILICLIMEHLIYKKKDNLL